MERFHSPDYINYLSHVAPTLDVVNDFNLGVNDCPIFDGMFEFSSISCGGSIDAAVQLNA